MSRVASRVNKPVDVGQLTPIPVTQKSCSPKLWPTHQNIMVKSTKFLDNSSKCFDNWPNFQKQFWELIPCWDMHFDISKWCFKIIERKTMNLIVIYWENMSVSQNNRHFNRDVISDVEIFILIYEWWYINAHFIRN